MLQPRSRPARLRQAHRRQIRGGWNPACRVKLRHPAVPRKMSNRRRAVEQSPRVVGPGQSDQRPSTQAPSSAQSDRNPDATQDQQKGSAQMDRAPSTDGKDRDLSKAQDQAPSKQRTTGTQQRRPRGQVQDQRAPGTKQPGTAQKRDELSGQPKGQAKTQQPARSDGQSETQARSGEANAPKLSERQHTTIQQSFQRERNLNVVSRSDINVSISIGATFPRSVRLAPLPGFDHRSGSACPRNLQLRGR